VSGAPKLVLVTGPSAVGKTTLARRLAAAIGCPMVSRDEIKEGMVAAYGPGYDPAAGDPLALPAYDTFFAALDLLLSSRTTLVAEAAFQHRLWSDGLARLTTPYALRLIRCTAHPELLRSRHLTRRAALASRAAHDDAHPVAGSAFEALRVDAPTLDVATDSAGQPDGDYRPGFAEILEFAHG